VTVGEERTAPVVLEAGASSVKMLTLRGRVHATDGTPLAGVRISGGRRLWWEYAVRSGPDGAFEVTVPDSVDALFFYLPEFTSVVLPFDAAKPGDALDVTLVPGIASTQ
jgi:hypothetical protein